jgi:hypothetical protein
MTTGGPSVGLEACRSGWIFRAFAQSMLAGMNLRVNTTKTGRERNNGIPKMATPSSLLTTPAEGKALFDSLREIFCSRFGYDERRFQEAVHESDNSSAL